MSYHFNNNDLIWYKLWWFIQPLKSQQSLLWWDEHCLLCISTSFQVLVAPESWLKQLLAVFNLFCSFKKSTEKRWFWGKPSGSRPAFACWPALTKIAKKNIFGTFFIYKTNLNIQNNLLPTEVWQVEKSKINYYWWLLFYHMEYGFKPLWAAFSKEF